MGKNGGNVELQSVSYGHEREGTVMPKISPKELAIEESMSGHQREGTMMTKGLQVQSASNLIPDDDDVEQIKSDEQVMKMIMMSGSNEEKNNSDLKCNDTEI